MVFEELLQGARPVIAGAGRLSMVQGQGVLLLHKLRQLLK